MVPQPRGRAGDSRGNEWGFDQSFAAAVRRKYPGFALYIGKKGRSRLQGKTAVVLPKSSLRRVGLLARICWTKSQSPHYSPGLGGWWLQVTGALSLLLIKGCSKGVQVSIRQSVCFDCQQKSSVEVGFSLHL